MRFIKRKNGNNIIMREIIRQIDEVKRRVGLIIGKPLSFEINRGRNKYVRFDGYIENAYPAIFTIRTDKEGEDALQSYSYNDILTKNVRISMR